MRYGAATDDGEGEEERREDPCCLGGLAEPFAQESCVEVVEVCDWVFAFAKGRLDCHFVR